MLGDIRLTIVLQERCRSALIKHLWEPMIAEDRVEIGRMG